MQHRVQHTGRELTFVRELYRKAQVGLSETSCVFRVFLHRGNYILYGTTLSGSGKVMSKGGRWSSSSYLLLALDQWRGPMAGVVVDDVRLLH